MTTQNGVLLYSQDYDTRTKNTIEGYHVIVRPSGSRAAELRLSQTLTVEVVGMVEDTKSCAIPEDGFLLAIANDTIYKNALAALQSLVMGEQLTIQVTCASGWENVTSACGGGDILVENGSVCTDFTLDSARKWPPAPPSASRTTARSSSTPATRLATRGPDARAAGRADAGARLPDRAEP